MSPEIASDPKLFFNATILTVNASREVILNGFLLVEGDRISAIGKCPYPTILPSGTREIDCQDKIIIPGLINTHAHLVQSLLRGLAEDLPLHNWLCDAVWPLEAAFDADDGYHAARLTMAEMLKTGTTCFLDPMLTYRAGFDRVCQAMTEMGIRGCLGKLVKFTETNRQLSISDPRDQDLLAMSIPELLNAHQKYHNGNNGRIHVWAAAGTPRGAPISQYLELGETCSSNGISVTMHCAEAPRDREIYHESYGCSSMEFIQQAKLCPQSNPDRVDKLSHRLVLAHMVNLDNEIDIPLLASSQTSVAHNPTSNLKLASGVAPVPAMISGPSAVNVSLGTDGAPCCNSYDMIQEMHLAGILHKGVNHDAALIPAETALEMATINGARALGLESDIGSLEVGKKADLVLLDPYRRGNLAAAPWSCEHSGQGVSPATAVVHACTGRDVDMTVVNGEILVEQGRLVHGGSVKEVEIVQFAQRAVKDLLSRCNDGREDVVGAKLQSGWNYNFISFQFFHFSIVRSFVRPFTMAPTATSVSTASSTATASCIASMTPGKNGYLPPESCDANLYYVPSYAAAIVFCIFFSATTIAHLVQAILYKKGYVWVIIMGAAWELLAFIFRALLTRHQNSATYDTLYTVFFLLAPIWINAFLYMTLGRMIHFYIPEKRFWGIPAPRFGVIFVCLDIVAFIVQAAGAMMTSAQGDVKVVMNGLHLYMGGIGLQEAFIICFTVMTIHFHRRLIHMENIAATFKLTQSPFPWRWLFYTIYFALVMITVRIIFRISQYGQGTSTSNQVLTNEAYEYVFDATPMLLALIALNVLNPGQILQGEDAKFEKLSRGEKKQRKMMEKMEKQSNTNGLSVDNERQDTNTSYFPVPTESYEIPTTARDGYFHA
ncbi:hypothetical protein N7495_006694 [Penicillium taxi]|uniref:uncharacterized protein n=1 Tax=Penicillium taxi TaxID=168475 RepID=UPI00254587BA|nr:uncharacterized protein N7495_006694 [Penicillium taxi]KAJ5895003.1 hypothetical protein N7495_006694 [Penicillium taxi]